MLPRTQKSGFTLVELIASATVIMLLMLMLVQMSKSTADTWKRGLSRSEQFRESRRAFELVTRRLATATLNPYWDYDYAGLTDPNAPPKGYLRQSELRFRVLSMETLARETGYHPTYGVFFQSPSATLDSEDDFWTKAYVSKTDRAPVNRLDGLINSWGYFLEVADTAKTMPTFLASNAKPRFRSQLLEFREDTIDLSVYKLPIDKARDDWFMGPITKSDSRPVHVVAENIIAMVLLPRLSATDEAIRRNTASIGPNYQLLSPKFSYDSKKVNNYDQGDLPATALPNQINPYNQLPPVVQIAMVALDESSANKLAASAADATKLDISTLTSGLFQRAEFLESRPSADGDLTTLGSRLIARGLSYRLFVSNVSIRGARWSAAQVSHASP